jgi:dynein heavy chain
LFIMAIANSQPSEDLAERLEFLNAEFLISLYRNICRSLFEKDKLIFSFLLTCKLLEMRGELNFEEFRFFLTGGISMGGELPPAPAQWLSEKSWGEILRLEDMPAFAGFVEHFKKRVDVYRHMYESAAPHEYEIKEPDYQKLNPFQKMIILRCLRGDKAVPAITGFVVHNLGKDFVTPPPFELPSIYKDSTSITPLIFVLSPGSDPLNFLVKFAESKKK